MDCRGLGRRRRGARRGVLASPLPEHDRMGRRRARPRGGGVAGSVAWASGARGAAAARADEHPAAGKALPEQRRRVSGRLPDRLQRSGRDGQGPALGAPARFLRVDGPRGDRGRHPAVLVARRPLHRLLRRQEAEAYRSLRRDRRSRSTTWTDWEAPGRRTATSSSRDRAGRSFAFRHPAEKPSPLPSSTPRKAKPRTDIRSSCRTASTSSSSP